ncbi:MAG: aminotransferase class IV [Planctomycetaceae bacterium]|nr:aminotransferase class IV [Planctomycetaceae bacterium]
MSVPLANWNGELLPLDQVRVPVLDRSFLFGDAVYEMLRVYDGQPFLLAEHLERLRYSLSELRIRTDVDRLTRRMHETLQLSRVTDGVVYLHISRGVAPQRTHKFPVPPPTPNELIYVASLPRDAKVELASTGARVVTFDDVRWRRCDIKSANLLGNILAAQAAEEAECDEAILIDAEDVVTEGAHTSVFGVRGGRILTAPLAANVLPGITRKLVVRLATSCEIPLVEESLKRDAIWDLDELFITGTTTEVMPVVQVNGRTIGDGRPGPVTLRLRQAYLQFITDGRG